MERPSGTQEAAEACSPDDASARSPDAASDALLVEAALGSPAVFGLFRAFCCGPAARPPRAWAFVNAWALLEELRSLPACGAGGGREARARAQRRSLLERDLGRSAAPPRALARGRRGGGGGRARGPRRRRGPRRAARRRRGRFVDLLGQWAARRRRSAGRERAPFFGFGGRAMRCARVALHLAYVRTEPLEVSAGPRDQRLPLAAVAWAVWRRRRRGDRRARGVRAPGRRRRRAAQLPRRVPRLVRARGLGALGRAWPAVAAAAANGCYALEAPLGGSRRETLAAHLVASAAAAAAGGRAAAADDRSSGPRRRRRGLRPCTSRHAAPLGPADGAGPELARSDGPRGAAPPVPRQLLLLSGVGDAAALAKVGVAPRVHLPNVGRNLRDFAGTGLVVRARDDGWDRRSQSLAGLAAYGAAGAGPLSATSQEVQCFHGGGGGAAPKYEFFYQAMAFPFAHRTSYDDHVAAVRAGALPRAFTVHCCLLKPRSAGAVTLASNDAFAPPTIAHGYLADPRDLADLVAALRLARAVVAATGLSGEEAEPGAAAASDGDLEAYVRRSFCHFAGSLVGTCRMGDDAGAVVDARLRVRGAARLRVVDASVLPTTVSGQPLGAVSAVAHRAAGLVLEDRRG
ncbi:THO complex subunit [Aureococcus anophagefferens]|uniref:THO complex subunit n=1 Tax=Aureococcus anophagefferens TaxID=44056 RepID=A0ABR1FHT3_AURAN